MRADVLIRHDGFKALFASLDPVEAERFISLLRRDSFDYTEWRKPLWEDGTVRELSDAAAAAWKKRHP